MTSRGRGEATRERILAAASTVIRERGLAHTTTKEIARVAGYSEATLYKHFTGKEDLFLAVLRIRLAPFIGLMVQLPEQAGSGTVPARLTELGHQMLRVYEESAQLAMALFAEPVLLDRQRELFRQTGAGPQHANAVLAEYLRRERERGRLAPTADPVALANLFLGACFYRAFLVAFLGPAGEQLLDHDPDRFVGELVAAMPYPSAPPAPGPAERRGGSPAGDPGAEAG
ncbi:MULTISPECIES: TetR/AcrR family transcriptional regulator [unclassified Plantactinospora]|uniref:TetR/AcrR family transcriptional regulator n=1 Tax=unclassified Plantactinospora TaxID=2631981 RepID=UPI000D154107|nr:MULTISPECIES: TetR/AcrR family transcriptional regulator [unclassified Plantactinospora]AVT31408.1 TetR/AcrR family transcriptional regulator [Plantactinospora sp. BC1]AVT38925.1 TetR/AcrR family transcriptional regulator [Plantactinospora sp. BB1]